MICNGSSLVISSQQRRQLSPGGQRETRWWRSNQQGTWAARKERSRKEWPPATGIAPFDLVFQPLSREIAWEEQRRKIAEAKRFILHSLANGPQLAAKLLEAETERGIAEGTLYYAKRALGVQSTRRGYQRPLAWSFAEQTAETVAELSVEPA